MTPQQVIALGIRLVSILIGTYSLRYLVGLPASMNTNGLGAEAYKSYITGGGYLLLAAFLWFFPMSIAHRILPRTRFENHMNLQAFPAAVVGCSLIGLWLAVSVLPALVWFFFSRLVNLGDHSFFGTLSPKEKLEFVFYLAELAFAIFLIFRAHLFAQLVLGKKNIG